MIAKVEPLTSARALRGPFDYRLPERMSAVDVGSVLLVPFGRQRLVGVVVALASASELPEERLVEPLRALERDLPPELLRLGLWVAEQYCSTRARGLALLLPPGTGAGTRRVGTRHELAVTLTEPGHDLAAALDRGDVGAAAPAARADAVADTGRAGAVAGVYAGLGARQRSALVALRNGPLPVAELVSTTGCGHAALRGLERRRLVEVASRAVSRRAQIRRTGAPAPAAIALTAPQERALATVLARMDAPAASDRRLLLHGVTGSGKTEVYLRAVGAALERGRSAIVLVPEIALTPQTAGRFRDRFGDAVALLHSKLPDGARHDEWVRLRRGEARVCVGPRSAVFAPLEDVGLIVVDEEHDASYKQEGDPRYDARHVAERRAHEAGAVLLLGSATPRPESWRRLTLVAIPERVDGQRLPPVELLSTAGLQSALHPRTRAALERVRAAGDKAIVMLNRRGWSNFLTCRGCGRVWDCPRCDVSLVLHRGAGRMSCHHCGHAEPPPGRCPDCGSVSLARHGLGTERLERELAAALEPLPIFRLDADTGAAAGAIDAVLGAFEAAPSGVLVGTQMVAKGHDFPAVTLGVLLDADATLRFPDFRAEERTFSLVAQLAGRSGRGPRGGSVLVQALDVDAPALRFAAAHDAAGFVEEELGRREALGYPPYTTLVRIVCSAPVAGPELEAAGALRRALEPLARGGATMLGPVGLFRRKGRSRAQLVVKTSDRRAAVASIRAAVDSVAGDSAHRGVALSVDVDPQ